MSFLQRQYSRIQFRLEMYKTTPTGIRERWRLGLKRALRPNINFPVWVTTLSGAKVFLDEDVIDESILDDISSTMIDRYFPDSLKLKSGDVVLDVGGHHGLYAVELLARFPGIKILSIEPDPEGIDLITRHIERNNAGSNIKVIPFAIGTEEGEGFLADNHDGSWGKTLENDQSDSSVAVRVKTLDQILENGDRNVRFIKSNCEGGEFDLVPQMIGLGLKPDLIILMVHPPRGNMQELVTMLEDYGYEGRLAWDSDVNPCWHFELKQNAPSQGGGEFSRI
ncbi:MAG: FkbM family methyltransferase [Saprospiraceae bacterium]|nr:FkbM family methyltransferase [Pyrinomonadaceae bacterium]